MDLDARALNLETKVAWKIDFSRKDLKYWDGNSSPVFEMDSGSFSKFLIEFRKGCIVFCHDFSFHQQNKVDKKAGMCYNIFRCTCIQAENSQFLKMTVTG